jgi:transcriptional regulator with XRE-family HTH domain
MCQKGTLYIMKCAIIEPKGSDFMFKETFAANLKRARENSGYTQQYVADVLSISRTNIAKYESGTLEPNIETIGELAELYKVTTDWLFGIIKSN